MERLTFEGSFCDIARCTAVPGGTFCEDGTCAQRKTWERLKAYEVTGLTPDICANYRKFEDQAISKGVTFGRIVELMNAEADGRLQVLPCKVGDLVWGIRNYKRGKVAKLGRVTAMYYAYGMQLHITVEYTCTGVWGKNVFSTREEAEEALEGVALHGTK